MKIFLDNIIFDKVKNGGVSNYWFELIKYLENTAAEVHYLESKKPIQNFHRKQLKLTDDKIIYVKDHFLSRMMPVNYSSKEKFIYHSSYYRSLTGSNNALQITTVYDFIHSYYAGLLNKTLHNYLKFNAIKKAHGIVCISHNTYNDLKKFYTLKPNQKATVIHVGVSDDYFKVNLNAENFNYLKNKFAIKNPYIIFIGGRTHYKNFDFVTQIINQSKDLHLVVVGGGNFSEKELKLFSKDAMNKVIYIPTAQNSDLNLLFNFAGALVYPSSYEGFGIPVVEAMRAGCPVIGLNNATIREVAENSAILLEKLNVDEFFKKFALLQNKNFKNEKIEIGFNEAKKYSWHKCSQETFAFYEEVFGSSYS